jgi:UDP-glucose 4-epimerase
LTPTTADATTAAHSTAEGDGVKALVTGGAGFIGSHLVDALVARGDSVVVIDDLSTGRRENLALAGDRVRLIEGCVTDRAAVDAAMAGCEVVFHQAAVASVPATIDRPVHTNRVNFGGTLNVLEAARAAGARRVVFASSAALYGDVGDTPCHEGMAPNPQSPYAVEKLGSEHYVRVWAELFGLETVALRYFNVFGPRQDPSSAYSGVISIFVDRLRRGLVPTIYGDGEQTRDFVYVGDVVAANLAAADVERAPGLVCNIGRGDTTTLNTLYGHLAAILGGPPAPSYGPTRAGDIRHSRANVDRAAALLGWCAQVPVAEGLRALVDG